MKIANHIPILILIVLWAADTNAQKFEFHGFIDSYHAASIKEPHDFLSSRSRFRGQIRGSKGRSSLYASINANHHYLLPDRTFIELREAYMDYAGENWDLRAGRQIIIWGVADGIRITDIISPMDFTEFLARDYDDIRMPVDALKLRAFNNNMKFELVWVPVFQSFIYPVDPENPWSIVPPAGNGPVVKIARADLPEPVLKNSEIGGKLSFYLSGFDLSLSSLYTWNKFPVFRTKMTEGLDSMILFPGHHRLGMVGVDLSKPLGSLVIRAEGAYFTGEYFPSQINGYSNRLKKSDVLRYLVGMDWYPGHEWSVTGQFSHTCILDFDQDLEEDQHTCLATLGISKKIFHSTLSVSTFGYMDLTHMGFFNRTSIDYSLSDQIHLLMGVDLFGGDGGMFGVYGDNSELWIKAKYSF